MWRGRSRPRMNSTLQTCSDFSVRNIAGSRLNAGHPRKPPPMLKCPLAFVPMHARLRSFDCVGLHLTPLKMTSSEDAKFTR